ncbi:MtN3-like protein [Phytophthora megakarya]|uniref:MtN3-like protein n=1 Tax=Phytophthora megakarya TaxID=4795 RepID=A0A225WLH0_9STRA|nr:MtN3-like protein [Phytophthora megakarya]
MVNAIVETLFRVLASITSISVTLSMIPSMYRIYLKKDTGIASVLPLVCMVANAHVWMLDGAIVQNWFPMFATFLTSDFIAMGYVAVFFCFARDRNKALRRILTVGSILILITIYAVLGKTGFTNQSNDGVDTTLGILGVMASLSMFSSPFERMRKVLHYKSAAFIPIPMVVAGALNNVMWITYAPMIENWFLCGNNVMCLLISTVNIALYVIYNPKTHPLRLEEDDPEFVKVDPMRGDPASVSMVLSPLPSDDEIGLKTKHNSHSPMYNMLRSPIGIPSDVSTRV